MDDVLGYQGTRAVVTGATSGMGQATAKALVDLGAEVIGLDVKPGDAPGVTSIQVDLRDKDSIDAAVASIGGGVNSLFACAGLPGPPFSDHDTMLVNFVGTRHLIDRLVPSMAEASAIAWIASQACIGWQDNLLTLMALIDTDGFETGRQWCEDNAEAIALTSAYAFSKQAINAFVASRSRLFYDKGVRLNCSNPGPTETPMMAAFHDSAGKQLVDMALGAVPRYSTPEEQAWPVIFLNSPRSSYVTGEAFAADGGFFGLLTTNQIDFSQLTG
jgi:NAD(P)-dependent dehydrogenase (short-subunit alcohol dehydrogenase family)